MKNKVIILNGSGGVGKDTFVNCVEKFINVYHYSSVSKIKEIASLMGWEGGKSEKDRKFLSDLKMLSTKYNNLPFIEIEKIVDRFERFNDKDSLLFIDIREPNEIEKAVKAFSAVTVLVTNNNIKGIESNIADKNVLNYQYDYIIENSGDIEKLTEQAKTLVALYKKGELRNRKKREEEWIQCYLNCKHSYDDDGVIYCTKSNSECKIMSGGC